MKLRILGNSLRLRLDPPDVERLIETGRVEQHTAFGPQASHRLYYALEISPDASDIQATLDGANIRVVLPPSVARRWATTDQISIEARQDVGGGVTDETLLVLVEKDLGCDHDDRAPDSQRGADARPARNSRKGR